MKIITSILEDKDVEVECYYSIDGRRMTEDCMTGGIYVARYSDGSSRLIRR